MWLSFHLLCVSASETPALSREDLGDEAAMKEVLGTCLVRAV